MNSLKRFSITNAGGVDPAPDAKGATPTACDAIHSYIDAEQRREAQYLADHPSPELPPPEPARAPFPVLDSAPAKWTLQRIKEFYWTVTRLVGLAHLHDGSRPPPPPCRFKRGKDFFAKFDQTKLARAAARPGPRIYLDVTQTLLCDFEAGIPRVVRKLSSAALDLGGVPVFMHDGEIWTIEAYNLTPTRVTFHCGDVFAIIDQGWTFTDQLRCVMDRVRSRGARSVLLIYDMLPITHPNVFPAGFSAEFAYWLDEVALRADAVVALAEHGARELAAYAHAPGKSFNPAMRLGWRHLGADFVKGDKGPTTRRVSAIAARGPFFLTVSTLEPRKGYAIALDAMERLWRSGFDAQYVIVGRYGWNCRALAHRIRTHPELGRRLHWLFDASDEDLRGLYRNAHRLIYPSVAEGFGLPIVEAARFGLPAIASDIPVFREICGDDVVYFDAADPASLAIRLREALETPRPSPKLQVLTWDEVTARFLAMIADDSYQFRHLGDAVSRSDSHR